MAMEVVVVVVEGKGGGYITLKRKIGKRFYEFLFNPNQSDHEQI